MPIDAKWTQKFENGVIIELLSSRSRFIVYFIFELLRFFLMIVE